MIIGIARGVTSSSTTRVKEMVIQFIGDSNGRTSMFLRLPKRFIQKSCRTTSEGMKKYIFVGLPEFTEEDVNELNTWVKDGTFVFV